MQFLISRDIDMTIRDYRWGVTAEGWARVAAKDEKLGQFLQDAQQRGSRHRAESHQESMTAAPRQVVPFIARPAPGYSRYLKWLMACIGTDKSPPAPGNMLVRHGGAFSYSSATGLISDGLKRRCDRSFQLRRAVCVSSAAAA